jgi:predicted transcriptional regulator
MSACKAFDPMAAALSLARELRAELGARGFEQRVIDGMSVDLLAELLECPTAAVSALLAGKAGKESAPPRVVCTLKERVAGGGGLDGARRHKREEMARIAARQAAFIEQVKARVARGEVETWRAGEVV